MSLYQKTHETLVRAAAGDPDAREAATALLLHGIRTYLNAGGELDLARCIGLPTPAAKNKFAQLRRNYWLCMAAGQLTAASPWERSVALQRELNKFLAGIWSACQGKDEPPPSASKLHACLFRAVAATPGKIPTAIRHLHRIVGEVETEISTQRSLRMKSLEVIEREARLEWLATSGLREEFPELDAYLAFRRAEAEDRITIASDKTEPCNVTGQQP
jgi:hypothetical protein